MFDRNGLDQSGILHFLQATDGLQHSLFKFAQEVRHQNWGDEVVLRGAVEISNYCRKNCAYCAMRRSNAKLERYRMTAEELSRIAEEVKKLQISTLFIQSGQDVHIDKMLEEALPRLKRNADLDIILCIGERSKDVYRRFCELGADGFILKFETSDPNLYEKLSSSTHERRVECLQWIREAGMKVGTGNIVGLPNQSLESVANDIMLGAALKPDFVSVSPFIPSEDTPLKSWPHGDVNQTLNTLALWRIILKDALIPTVSALEKIRPQGQLLGFHAGANVITINFTPAEYRRKYPIYAKERFIVSLEHALNTIRLAGLKTGAGFSELIELVSCESIGAKVAGQLSCRHTV